MKNDVARAEIALPNGCCTLTSPAAVRITNACSTCPVFVTTVESFPGTTGGSRRPGVDRPG